MQKTPRLLAIAFILVLLISALGEPVPAAPANFWQDKVDPWVLSTVQKGETEFLVFLREQADLSAAEALKSKEAKGTYVYEMLTSTAAATQTPLQNWLASQGVTYQSFWVVNALWVRGNLDLIQQIAQRSDVAHIYANPEVKLSLPEQEFLAAPQSPTTIEWNILKINADDVWAEGYTGQNVVIGGADTGYDWDHPAIINQYRGWNGATADHDYNWHDATGLSPIVPVDPYGSSGHGTHTMGTMVGEDGGGSNQIGVAPGARWIGCRNMDVSGYGTPTRYIECYQWFIAPTRTDGSDPDPAMAPHVINNSWGCPPDEGCTDVNILLTAVQNVRAAGILTAHSAGNEGSSCSSVQTPGAIYGESFTVGAVYSDDSIVGFSSRGPVNVDGSNRRKPDITAPGSSIRSCLSGGGYGNKSGTSMAAPHIAGVVALLISAQPNLAGQVDELETLIEQTAVPLYTSQGCGGDPPDGHPNNVYGWGRVDALAAYLALPSLELALEKTVSSITAIPGTVLTYTLTVTNNDVVSITHNVMLEDPIPVGTDFVSATGNYSVTGELVTWDLGDLSPGEGTAVNLIVQVPTTAPAGTVINEQYTVHSDEGHPVMGEPITTYVFKLSVDKTAPAAISPGSFLTYTLQVTNLQPYTITHAVVLTDVVPGETEFITATADYSIAGDLVTWNIGDLEGGQESTVYMVVHIPITTPLGTIVNNQYSARSDEVDPVFGDPVSTYIHMLTVHKAAPEIVVRGYALTYTLATTNLQPDVSTHNVVLTDTLPAGTEWITATGNFTLTGDQVAWELGDLGASESVTVSLVVGVPITATGTITNAMYGALSDEIITPAMGIPVSTFVQEPGLSWTEDLTCADQWLMPGDVLVCQHYLQNTGNYTDTFELTLESINGEAQLSTNEVTLGAGQSELVTVTITAPVEIPSGEVITTTVTATSAADPPLSESLTTTSWAYLRFYLPLIVSGQ